MSSLDALIQGDVGRHFLNTFGLTAIQYTPAGGAQRPINCIIDEAALEEVFETGTADLDYDILVIWISAVNDVDGVVAPNELGRSGSDAIAMNGQTWYVHKILNRAVAAGTGMHKLLISTSQAPLPSFG